MKENEEKITFHNKISPNYREIHIDGAVGGVTPRGLLNISFFAERFPIPKSTTYKVINNQIGPKFEENSKEGIIREYEFGVYMEIKAAKDLANWLNEQITIIENLTKIDDSNISSK